MQHRPRRKSHWVPSFSKHKPVHHKSTSSIWRESLQRKKKKKKRKKLKFLNFTRLRKLQSPLIALTHYQGFYFFRYSFRVHVTLSHHFSAPGWRSHSEWINKLRSQPQAPASYCLTSPFFWDPLWTPVRSLLLQPHCAHSCSHFLNQSGCSGRAQLHLSLCDQGTAGSLLWSAPCWSGTWWVTNRSCSLLRPQSPSTPRRVPEFGGFVRFLGFIELKAHQEASRG